MIIQTTPEPRNAAAWADYIAETFGCYYDAAKGVKEKQAVALQLEDVIKRIRDQAVEASMTAGKPETTRRP